MTNADDALIRAQMVVDEDGSPSDEAELVLLRQEMEESQRMGDTGRLESLTEAAESLVHRVLLAQPWFWVSLLEGMRDPDREFVNRAQAQRQLNAGECAIRDNDFDGLRESVMRLWELRPKDSEEVDMERAIRSGLRRY